MPNIYVPEKRTIGEMLATTNPPLLVPDFQRNFSWNDSHVSAFWKDLIAFDERFSGSAVDQTEYFLGSVVLVDSGESHLIIDGQQRLATSAILLSVIRDTLKPFHYDAAKDVQDRYLAHRDFAKDRLTYKITLNRFDKEFFQRLILENRSSEYVSPTPAIESHKLILKARDFLNESIGKRISGLEDQKRKIDWILRLQNILTNRFSTIAVRAGNENDATSIFETLNDRGIGLSSTDLIRHFLLVRTPPEQLEDVVDLWSSILAVDKEAKLETFLRHYWISHYGDIKTRSLYREIRTNVEENRTDSLNFSRLLKDASSEYSELLSCTSDDADTTKYLTDLDSLGVSLFYPLLLAGVEVAEVNDFRVLVRACICAYVRHTVTLGLESSRLEAKAYELAPALRSGQIVAPIIQALQDFSPDDTKFEAGFAELSITRGPTVRYVLKELEHDHRNQGETIVWRKAQIEHIYPQSPRQGHRWADHDQMVNRVGNLTLLHEKLNAGAKNAPFAEKKAYYQRSDIKMTNGLVQQEDWTANQVKSRQRDLASRAKRIWAF